MASLKIELDFDVSAFEKESDAYVRDVLIPASVDALNAAAEAGRLAVVEAMPAYIDRPTPFTLNAISVFEAKAVDPYGHEMSAYVHVMPQQARYLEYEILGGTRGPGDYATTAQGPLIPGPDAQLDAYGNLPRGYVEGEVADGAVWVHLKPGEPPALVKRVGSRLEILALIVHELHYDRARLPFYDLVTGAVASTFPAAFAEALEAYGS